MSSGSFEAGHEIQDMQPSEEERRAERDREREKNKEAQRQKHEDSKEVVAMGAKSEKTNDERLDNHRKRRKVKWTQLKLDGADYDDKG